MVNFLVYRLENGKWNKMTERKWLLRYGHSCELLDHKTMVVIGAQGYYKNVDILDLESLSWTQVKSNQIRVKRIQELSVSGSRTSCEDEQ